LSPGISCTGSSASASATQKRTASPKANGIQGGFAEVPAREKRPDPSPDSLRCSRRDKACRRPAKAKSPGNACSDSGRKKGASKASKKWCEQRDHHASPRTASGAVTMIDVLRRSEPVQPFPQSGHFPLG